MGSHVIALASLLLVCVVSAPAFGDVIFNNFGPGDSYLFPGGWGVSVGPHIPLAAATGERFIPVGASFRLDRIEVAMHVAEGGELTSPNTVDVMLMTDVAGAPGVVIETFHFNGLEPSTIAGPPLARDSTVRPVLVDGTPYWLVASATLPDTIVDWHVNAVGAIGPHACSSTAAAACVGTQIGQWFIHNDFQGAFRVSGTPAEPVPSLINDLIGDVEGLALRKGTTTSLVAKLKNAIAAFNRGGVVTACADLTAFINEVNAQTQPPA